MRSLFAFLVSLIVFLPTLFMPGVVMTQDGKVVRESSGQAPDYDHREMLRKGPDIRGRSSDRRRLASLLTAHFGPGLSIQHGELSSMPRHLFFPDRALTAAFPGSALERAAAFLADLKQVISPGDGWGKFVLIKEYVTRPSGVTHLVYNQRFKGMEVFQGEITVNVDAEGRIINMGADLLEAPRVVLSPKVGLADAIIRVAADLAGENGRDWTLARLEPSTEGNGEVAFQLQGWREEGWAREVLFPVGGEVHACWLVELSDREGINRYETVLDRADGALLYRHNLTWYRDDPLKGLVFGKGSPQPWSAPGVLPPSPNPPNLMERNFESFAGDPAASPLGWVGPNLDTVGNNIVAREDLAGDDDLTFGRTAVATDDGFVEPLELGPGAPPPQQFSAASVVNLFYWCNVAHDYFYRLGFDEPAGNYQADNMNLGGKGGDPVRVDAQKGATSSAFPSSFRNNAYFSGAADGRSGRIGMYLWGRSGGPYVDSGFDADVILHEYTHGVSTRLVRSLSGAQGGAMGEGWSDFFALHMLTPEEADPEGLYTVGAYSSQDFEQGIRTRPYSTSLEVNPLTYADIGTVIGRPEVHADGEIWVQALWDLRAGLIGRYGFSEGARRVAQMVIDGMKLSPPRPTLVDMRDAILLGSRASDEDADRDLIWAAFAKRGLGFLADGSSAGSVHVLASFDLPSNHGSVKTFETSVVVGEPIRFLVGDSNQGASTITVTLRSASGDRETVTAVRRGSIFANTVATSGGSQGIEDGVLQVKAGDIVVLTYHDLQASSGGAAEAVATTAVLPAYEIALMDPDYTFEGSEIALRLRGDNQSTSVPFAFDFPFYGRTYRRVYVSTNGLINLAISDTSSFNSNQALNSKAAIAPCWMNLRTNGTAQEAEDLYIKRRPDSLMIRWVAETVERDSSGELQAGKPANFAVVLQANGSIIFKYGTGNRSMAGLDGPTVGVSRGTETYQQLVPTHNRMLDLEGAPTVLFDLPAGR
ncbi:MAG: M36 family metallopeptidase [Acidobacteria bacterium]|nr:M36 family metallopeptidase [Acidobacteriota bacterium]